MEVPAAGTGTGTVLVVDDEPTIREVVAEYLRRDGFEVVEAADGPTAAGWLAANRPTLVVLDVMLTGLDGLEILKEVRTRSEVPVILLTARTDEVDRIVGLELGADDYVVKPFSPRELSARVRTVLRRVKVDDGGASGGAGSDGPADAVLEFDGLRIDLLAREVSRDGNQVALTPKEFDLLVHLASSPRQVFSRRQLLDRVWDSSPDYQDPATVTVHVGRLRQKLEADAEEPRWIVTVWGVGYRFEP